MAVSYRGKQVDMVSLAKKYEKFVALGNAHMNGKGDILGRDGKIVKSREKQLSEYYEKNPVKSDEVVNLKKESVKEVEKEVSKIQEDNLIKAKPRKKPVYEDITEEEKAELDNLKA